MLYIFVTSCSVLLILVLIVSILFSVELRQVTKQGFQLAYQVDDKAKYLQSSVKNVSRQLQSTMDQVIPTLKPLQDTIDAVTVASNTSVRAMEDVNAISTPLKNTTQVFSNQMRVLTRSMEEEVRPSMTGADTLVRNIKTTLTQRIGKYEKDYTSQISNTSSTLDRYMSKEQLNRYESTLYGLEDARIAIIVIFLSMLCLGMLIAFNGKMFLVYGYG